MYWVLGCIVLVVAIISIVAWRKWVWANIFGVTLVSSLGLCIPKIRVTIGEAFSLEIEDTSPHWAFLSTLAILHFLTVNQVAALKRRDEQIERLERELRIQKEVIRLEMEMSTLYRKLHRHSSEYAIPLEQMVRQQQFLLESEEHRSYQHLFSLARRIAPSAILFGVLVAVTHFVPQAFGRPLSLPMVIGLPLVLFALSFLLSRIPRLEVYGLTLWLNEQEADETDCG